MQVWEFGTRRVLEIGYELEELLLDTPLDDGSPYRGRCLHYRR